LHQIEVSDSAACQILSEGGNKTIREVTKNAFQGVIVTINNMSWAAGGLASPLSGRPLTGPAPAPIRCPSETPPITQPVFMALVSKKEPTLYPCIYHSFVVSSTSRFAKYFEDYLRNVLRNGGNKFAVIMCI